MCETYKGKGKLILADKDTLEGNWINDSISFGWLKSRDGVTYEGSFVNNLKHGIGTIKFANGEKLVGEFANGTF
jgi:hypothetical protein